MSCHANAELRGQSSAAAAHPCDCARSTSRSMVAKFWVAGWAVSWQLAASEMVARSRLSRSACAAAQAAAAAAALLLARQAFQRSATAAGGHALQGNAAHCAGCCPCKCRHKELAQKQRCLHLLCFHLVQRGLQHRRQLACEPGVLPDALGSAARRDGTAAAAGGTGSAGGGHPSLVSQGAPQPQRAACSRAMQHKA